MRELRLQGPELARLRCSPGAHVTVSVPDEAVTVRRVYSVWDSDPVAALRLRIALHDGGGPGCAWVLAARPGDEVTLEPPRSKITIDPRAAYNLFVGDETGAVPLLAMHAAAGMFVASRAPHRHLA